MKKIFAGVVTLALMTTLASCSSPANESPSDASSAPVPDAPKVPGKGNISSDGVDFTTLTEKDLKLSLDDKFDFITEYGTTGTIEFISPDDKRVGEIEKYRKATHGSHTEYLIAEVDNRKGTEGANMYEVTYYDPEGTSYSYRGVDETIEQWQPYTNYDDDTTWLVDDTKISEQEFTALYNEGVELINENMTFADPLEKETFILAMPIDEGALPDEISGVTVAAHGAFEPTSAYNPLVSQYREWKAAQEAGQEWEAYDPGAEPLGTDSE